jgi:hypothetical protein
MKLAHRYLLFGAGWFFSVPLLAVAVFAYSAFGGNVVLSTLVSVVWTLGLVGIFWAWASKDVVALGKSKNVARWFTAAWLVLLVLAVFPYLFVTRGLKNGLLASLQFACYLLACGIVFLGVPAYLLNVLVRSVVMSLSISLGTDTQREMTALRPMLRAGQRQR